LPLRPRINANAFPGRFAFLRITCPNLLVFSLIARKYQSFFSVQKGCADGIVSVAAALPLCRDAKPAPLHSQVFQRQYADFIAFSRKNDFFPDLECLLLYLSPRHDVHAVALATL
jgi:hypothetical protein